MDIRLGVRCDRDLILWRVKKCPSKQIVFVQKRLTHNYYGVYDLTEKNKQIDVKMEFPTSLVEFILEKDTKNTEKSLI